MTKMTEKERALVQAQLDTIDNLLRQERYDEVAMLGFDLQSTSTFKEQAEFMVEGLEALPGVVSVEIVDNDVTLNIKPAAFATGDITVTISPPEEVQGELFPPENWKDTPDTKEKDLHK